MSAQLQIETAATRALQRLIEDVRAVDNKKDSQQ